MFTIKLFLSIIPIAIIALVMYKIDIDKEPKKVLKQIFISSITFSSMLATHQLIAFSFITSKRSSLFFSVSFFESLSPSISSPKGSITAAATTGPQRGPRPASSTPQTKLYPLYYFLIYIKFLSLTVLKHVKLYC